MCIRDRLRAVERLETVREPDRIGLWLSTVARRECMRIIETGARSVPSDPDVAFVNLRSGDDPGSDAVDRTEAGQVLKALGTLPQDCQALLRLTLADPPIPYRDIAEILDIAVGTIGPKRQRCLSRLRSALG